MFYRLLLLSFLVSWCGATPLVESSLDDGYDPSMDPHDYGMDVSFPQHHHDWDSPDKSSNPTRAYFAERYEKHIQGCYDMYSIEACRDAEDVRRGINLRQPPTQHNYTKTGYTKTKLPKKAFNLLRQYYDQNLVNEHEEPIPGEQYGPVIIVNKWKSPVYFVDARGLSDHAFDVLSDTVKPIVSEWVGQEVTEASFYGIRVYKNNSVLATHVDLLPLISSVIINVAQDVDEPWPLEVIGHDGKAHNLTMEPGEMLLYESHTILHGRPFPLNGRYFANYFMHYTPVGHEGRSPTPHGLNTFHDAAQRASTDAAPQALSQSGRSHPPVFLESCSDPNAASVLVELLSSDPAKLIETKTKGGNTCLLVAAEHDAVENVKVLLAHGANVNAKQRSGRTALMIGAANGNLELVKSRCSPLCMTKRRLTSAAKIITNTPFSFLVFLFSNPHCPLQW